MAELLREKERRWTPLHLRPLLRVPLLILLILPLLSVFIFLSSSSRYCVVGVVGFIMAFDGAASAVGNRNCG